MSDFNPMNNSIISKAIPQKTIRPKPVIYRQTESIINQVSKPHRTITENSLNAHSGISNITGNNFNFIQSKKRQEIALKQLPR